MASVAAPNGTEIKRKAVAGLRRRRATSLAVIKARGLDKLSKKAISHLRSGDNSLQCSAIRTRFAALCSLNGGPFSRGDLLQNGGVRSGPIMKRLPTLIFDSCYQTRFQFSLMLCQNCARAKAAGMVLRPCEVVGGLTESWMWGGSTGFGSGAI